MAAHRLKIPDRTPENQPFSGTTPQNGPFFKNPPGFIGLLRITSFLVHQEMPISEGVVWLLLAILTIFLKIDLQKAELPPPEVQIFAPSASFGGGSGTFGLVFWDSPPPSAHFPGKACFWGVRPGFWGYFLPPTPPFGLVLLRVGGVARKTVIKICW